MRRRVFVELFLGDLKTWIFGGSFLRRFFDKKIVKDKRCHFFQIFTSLKVMVPTSTGDGPNFVNM